MSLLSVAINKQSYEGWRGFVVGVIPISMRMVSGDPTCMLPGERVSTRVHKLPLLLRLLLILRSCLRFSFVIEFLWLVVA